MHSDRENRSFAWTVRSESGRAWIELRRNSRHRSATFTKSTNARVACLEALCAPISVGGGLHVCISSVRINHSTRQPNARSKLIGIGNPLEVVCRERSTTSIFCDRVIRLTCIARGYKVCGCRRARCVFGQLVLRCTFLERGLVVFACRRIVSHCIVLCHVAVRKRKRMRLRWQRHS